MEVVEFQKLCAKTVKEIDRKYSINRDKQLNLSQLIEELGELAKEVNREKLRNQKPNKMELETEFADVLLQLMTLAESFDVNTEEAVKSKIEVLKKRHA